MQPLPRLFVDILNHFGTDLFEEVRLDWIDYRIQTEESLRVHSDFILSREDGLLQQNLPLQLAELDQMLSQEQLDTSLLMRRMVELAAGLETFYQARAREYFVAVPALDQLICAGIATLQKKAHEDAVARRLPLAALAVDELQRCFEDLKEGLPEEIRKAVFHGFQTVREGFALTEVWLEEPRDENLEQALFRCKGGGDLLSHLVHWLAEFDKSDQKEAATPIIGPLFSLLDRDFSPEIVAHLRDEKLPELIEFWEESAATLPVYPELLEALYEPIADTLSRLQDLLELDPVESEVWRELEQLEGLFAELRSQKLPLEELLESSFGPEASLVVAALHGGVPDLVLANAAREMSTPGAPEAMVKLGSHLARYLEERDPLTLLLALTELAEAEQLVVLDVEGCA